MKPFQLSSLFQRYFTWALIILLWVVLFNVPVSQSSEELKVGVYNFEPLVFMDENGKAQGLFVDVLNYIAEKEGWKISYVPGSWNECLTRLSDGKIDLLGSIAYSEKRAKKLDFTKEFLFLDWGLVYKSKGSPIETIFDLEGKKVSVLKGSIYTIGFKKLLDQFGIKSTLLEKDEYTQVFESIEDGEADAGINAQVYGMRIESDYKIEQTQIFFSPVKIRFAVPKGEQQFILNKLDEHFSALKADKQSHYYTLFNKWVGLYSRKEMFPRWLKGVLIAIVPIIFILISFNLLLKKEVERKTSELLSATDDLRESEERFRSTFEQAAVGIAHVALDGRFLRINQRFCDIVEYTHDEMLAHTFQDITYLDDLDTDLEYVHQVLSGEIQTYSMEKRYFKKNGSIVWVNLTVSLVRESSGEPKYFIGVVEDITKRKQAEESLLKNERKFRTLTTSAPVGIFQTDVDGNYIYVNERWCEVAGLSPEEAAGDGWVKALHSDDREKVYKAWYHSAKTGEEFALEYRFKTPGGKVTWLAGKAVALLNDSGETVGYLGTITDISERTRMEEMLRESVKQYRNLVETSQDLIWRCDSQGRFTFLNPACESIFGYKVEEMLGRHFNEFKPPEIAERDLEVFRKILKGKDFFGYETIYITKSGEQKNLVFNARILKDADGNIIGTQGTAHDITVRKRAEEEKATLKAQLVQVQKMEAIGTLAGGIAHDFNNILSSVLGFAELAKMNLATGGDFEKNLDEVMNAGLRARDLVKHILTFSRKADVQKQPTQISLLIKEALKFLRASLPTTIEVRSDLGVSDSTVMADSTQIHQVLMNLCTNAAHAMQEKGGVLDVRMEEVMLEEEKLLQFKDLKHGKYIRLTVGDTGHGIPKEIIDRIFDPFFTTKERSEGTGMGLATVHGIVKDMGGTISVYSEPGKGTTFHILLPKQEGEAADLTSPRYILKKGKGRILFVDDEKGIVVSSRQILERLGYEVVATTSSLEALKLFESGPDTFNLVLTDMTMPAMTGLELSKKLTEIRPDIPIVLCTGFSIEITTETIRDAGIREMIKKPMIASELAEAVEKALNHGTK